MPATSAIMVITLVASIGSIFRPDILMKFMLHPYTIFKKYEVHRLISADYIHYDFVHLAINEYLLYFVCGKLEAFLKGKYTDGELYFLIIYFGSMLFGSVVITFLYRNRFEFSGVGASGTIIGCLLSYMLVQPYKTGFYLPFVGEVNNMFSALIIIVGITIYQVRSKHPYINHEIHFFGGLGGTLITLILF